MLVRTSRLTSEMSVELAISQIFKQDLFSEKNIYVKWADKQRNYDFLGDKAFTLV